MMPLLDTPTLRQRLADIRLIATDVDGVLTPSTIIWDTNGVELKVFNVKDGYGLRKIRTRGIQTAIITGRRSSIVELRAKELDFDFCYQAVPNKVDVLNELCTKLGITPANVAYMGDDIPDVGVLERVGLAVAPADAHRRVLANVHWVSQYAGGQGAMRDFLDLWLEG